MPCGTSQVHQTAFGQQEDGMSCREGIFVHLRLDVDVLDIRIVHQFIHLNFVVEVTDVADDGLVFHLRHVLDGDDVTIPRRRHENVSFFDSLFHCCDFKSLHGSLQSANRVDFRDQDTRAVRAHRMGTTFAHVTITGHDNHFARNHHVGRPLDAVCQRFAATIEVVEFGFCHRVIDVDGWDKQFTLLLHLVEAVYAGRRLFRNPFHLADGTVPTRRVFCQDAFQCI